MFKPHDWQQNSFVSLDENIKPQITLGDGSKQEVAGKGTIVVRARNDSSKFIYDVFYVLGIAQNWLSEFQRGYMMKFDANKRLIFDKKKEQLISATQMAPNKIFPLRMQLEHNVALSSIVDESTL